MKKCSAKELKILGDFWTLTIIQELSEGNKRFSELERVISGISPTTLANRLKKLEINNLIKREKEKIDKLSIIYSLTNKGHGILPVLSQIRVFADKYL
ncbi:MAG: helix-turn-helix domain-containing protein [Patescibacteria group bacterium]